MFGSHASQTKALALGVLLVTAGLAGCMSSGESASLLADSYQAAKTADAAGPYEANMSDSQLSSMSEEEAKDIKIKLLEPAKTSGLEEGEQPVVVLLYDESEDEPITDATMAIEARMPAMGHGTQPEEDPVHEKHGQYQGLTSWSMSGSWLLNIDVQLSSGDVLAYDLHMDVGEDHGHADDGHDHEH